MIYNFSTLLARYIPVVWHAETPNLVNTVQRLIWNTGVWSTQSLGLHWLAKFAIMCFLSTNLTQVATLMIETDDTTRMFECFSIFSFCAMGNLKLLNLYANKERWHFIFSQMKFLEHQQLHGISSVTAEYDSDEEEAYAPYHISKYTRRYIVISSLLLKIYSITAIIFIATPFVEYAVHLLTATSDTDYYPHILPGWAPLDTLGFAGYCIGIIFEAVAAVYCLFVHTAFDLTAVGVMIFICGQFALLRHNTENIVGRGIDCMPKAARDMRAHFRIIETHRTHTRLCTVIKELDSSLQTILGVYFMLATLTVCSVALRLNSETLSFMQLASLLQYLCGILTQLFLFCTYGDAVFHESSYNMGEGPHGAAWWALRPRVRRELALLGAGMALPRRLHAGPFNTLNLPSFVQIVRAAYSYYAVLQQPSK